jgi:hypothetical protein
VPVPSCAPRLQEQGAGRDVTCAPFPSPHSKKVRPMNRFVVPFSFTVATVWVVVLFVLVSHTH